MTLSCIYSSLTERKLINQENTHQHNTSSGQAHAYDLAVAMDPCQRGPTKGNYDGPKCSGHYERVHP